MRDFEDQGSGLGFLRFEVEGSEGLRVGVVQVVEGFGLCRTKATRALGVGGS